MQMGHYVMEVREMGDSRNRQDATQLMMMQSDSISLTQFYLCERALGDKTGAQLCFRAKKLSRKRNWCH